MLLSFDSNYRSRKSQRKLINTVHEQTSNFIDSRFSWDIYGHIKSFLSLGEGIRLWDAFHKSVTDVRFNPETHPKSYRLWRYRQIPYQVDVTMRPNDLIKHPLAVWVYVLDDCMILRFKDKHCFCNRCVDRTVMVMF